MLTSFFVDEVISRSLPRGPYDGTQGLRKAGPLAKHAHTIVIIAWLGVCFNIVLTRNT